MKTVMTVFVLLVFLSACGSDKDEVLSPTKTSTPLELTLQFTPPPIEIGSMIPMVPTAVGPCMSKLSAPVSSVLTDFEKLKSDGGVIQEIIFTILGCNRIVIWSKTDGGKINGYETHNVFLDLFSRDGARLWIKSKLLDSGIIAPKAYIAYLEGIIYATWYNKPCSDCDDELKISFSRLAKYSLGGEEVLKSTVILKNQSITGIAVHRSGGIYTIINGVSICRFDMFGVALADNCFPTITDMGDIIYPEKILVYGDRLYMVGKSHNPEFLKTVALGLYGVLANGQPYFWVSGFHRPPGIERVDVFYINDTIHVIGNSLLKSGEIIPFDLEYSHDGQLLN